MLKAEDLTLGQKVKVDGVPGYITGIYPNGHGQYIGKQHAYVWVRTPTLDYLEYGASTPTRNGRAVSFDEIERRIKVIQDENR